MYQNKSSLVNKSTDLEYSKIYRLMLQGSYQEALNDVDQLLMQNKDYSEVYLRYIPLKVKILNRQGNYKEGLKLARKITSKNHNHEYSGAYLISWLTLADCLIHIGQLEEGLEVIETARFQLNKILDTNSLLFLELSASLNDLEGRILGMKGDFSLSLQSLNQCLDFAKRGDKNEILARGLLDIGTIYYFKGNFNEALNYFQRSLKYFQEIGDKQHIALALNNIGIIYMKKGKLENSLEFYTKSLILREEMGNKRETAQSLHNIGVIYKNRGELKQSLSFYQKSFRIFKSLGNERDLAVAYHDMGYVYRKIGELNLALDYSLRALQIQRKFDNKLYLAYAFNNVGEIYMQQGELKTALSYFNESLELLMKLGNEKDTAKPLHNIGLIFMRQGDQTKAIANLERSLAIKMSTDNYLDISTTLSDLICLLVSTSLVDLAKRFFHSLEEIHNKEKNRTIEQRYWLSKALILKISPQLKEWGKAEEILERLVIEDPSDYSIQITAMLNLIDLYLFEYQVTKNKVLLSKITELSKKLLNVAERNYSYSLLAETYLLQSKFALLELDIKTSQNYITQALAISNEKGLNSLKQKITRLQTTLEEFTNLAPKDLEVIASLWKNVELENLDSCLLPAMKIIQNHLTEVVRKRSSWGYFEELIRDITTNQ